VQIETVDFVREQELASTAAAEKSTYSKVTRRLIPVLLLGYVLAYLDRINIGFAQLQMKSELGFSDAVYGLGAGIFFIGYFLCEVPSNLLLARMGARRSFARIMIVWGLISGAMAFVHTPWSFYVLRFLLGVFEAGFFPGVMLYLTYWYPSWRRAKAMALFSCASAIAGVVGGPLSGWVLNNLSGYLGLRGWQWMFLAEGLPTALLGIVIYFYLDDHPRSARWLNETEKELIDRNLRIGNGVATEHAGHPLRGLLKAAKDAKLYLLAFSWFCFICGIYMINFWLPSLIKDLGVSDPRFIGLLVAIPYGVAGIGTITIGWHSDRVKERRWHCALPAFVGAAALIGLSFASGSQVVSFALLTIGSVGIFATVPLLWSMSSSYLGPAEAPGGLALINSVGLIGGFLSPFVLGWIRTTMGSLALGNLLIAALLSAGAIVILTTIRPAKIKNGV
jgi:D-galactonate transporter